MKTAITLLKDTRLEFDGTLEDNIFIEAIEMVDWGWKIPGRGEAASTFTGGGLPMKVRFRLVIACELLLLALSVFRHSVVAYQDRSVVKTEKDIPVVHNPKNPVPIAGRPGSLFLKEELTIGSDKGSDEAMLMDPICIRAGDDGRIFVLDRKAIQIKLYGPDGRFLKTIGKPGQGPGEMNGPRDFSITAGQELLVNDDRGRRILFFSLNGEFKKAIPRKDTFAFENPLLNAGGRIIAGASLMVEGEFVHELAIYGPRIERLTVLFSKPALKYPVFNPLFPRIRFQMNRDGSIVWAVTSKYELFISDPEGKTTKKIIKDYDPVPVLQEQKDQWKKDFYSGPDVRLDIPDEYPPFQDLVLDNEGRIFVRTYEKSPNTGDNYYDVFGPDGDFIAKVVLNGTRLPFWAKDKLYTLETGSDGLPLAKRYAAVWK
jgi:hypothetical protein